MADNRSGQIKKNTVYNTIQTIFGIIYPLITFPYVSRVLGVEKLGKINFSNSVLSYFILIASLGITTYAVRECSKVRNDRNELDRVASEIFSINVMSSMVAYLLLAIVLLIAIRLRNYVLLIGIQSSAIIFTTIGADWLNTATEHFKFIAVRTVTAQVISIILMVLFVRKPADYIIYSCICVFASSASHIVNILYRERFVKVRFTFKMNIKKHLTPIMLLFSVIITQTIYCNSDMTMIGLMRGDIETGLYGTSVKIYTLVNSVVASVAWIVIPGVSKAFSEDNYDEINRLIEYALNYIIVLGVPCLIGINIITEHLLEFFAGEDYVAASTSLHILTIALLFSFFGGLISNITMIPAGREKLCLISSTISSLINVILNLFLIPKYGLNAAAFTTAISELTGIIILLPRVDRRISISGIVDMIKAPFLGGVLMIGIGTLCKLIFSSASSIVVSTVGLCAISYGIILYVMKDSFFLSFIKKDQRGV